MIPLHVATAFYMMLSISVNLKNVKPSLVFSMFITHTSERSSVSRAKYNTRLTFFFCNNCIFCACKILRGFFHCFHVACWGWGVENSVHKWNFKNTLATDVNVCQTESQHLGACFLQLGSIMRGPI